MRRITSVIPMILLACTATPDPHVVPMNNDKLPAQAPAKEGSLTIHPVHHSAIVFE